jgi:cysteine desulfurase
MDYIYLDNASTTQPFDEVIEVVTGVMRNNYGNPSSLHRLGIEADKIIKDARDIIAKSMGASPAEIFFTSGGTESNNWAIIGAAIRRKKLGNHIITTKIEHPSVLGAIKYLEEAGFDVDYLNVDEKGTINHLELENKLKDKTILVSVIHVNNETGSILPIKEIATKVKLRTQNAYIHVDGVQGYCKVDFDARITPIDLYSCSGHKIGGPKGIGALYKRANTNINQIFFGGGQERGSRSGTENVHNIAGFASAVKKYMDNRKSYLNIMMECKEKLTMGILDRIPSAKVNSPEDSAPHILNISFPGVKGEILLHCLEGSNIFVSTGSACSSKKTTHSHVLEGMGIGPKHIEGAVRFSFSPFTSVDKMDYVAEKVYDCYRMLARRRK